jgi:hypothetical protein
MIWFNLSFPGGEEGEWNSIHWSSSLSCRALSLPVSLFTMEILCNQIFIDCCLCLFFILRDNLRVLSLSAQRVCHPIRFLRVDHFSRKNKITFALPSLNRISVSFEEPFSLSLDTINNRLLECSWGKRFSQISFFAVFLGRNISWWLLSHICHPRSQHNGNH